MRLDNTRWELFCLARFAGKTLTEAYKEAGYKADGHAAEVGASRLMSNPEIRGRIDELTSAAAEKLIINRETLTIMLMEDRKLAHNEGQASAARAISKTIGQLHGFAFDPIKEGGSVPLGQVKPQLQIEDKSAEVVDFAAMAARFGR